MFCYKCGEKLQDDARFCIKCGTPVDKVESKMKNTQPRRCPRCGSLLDAEGRCNFCITKAKIAKDDEKSLSTRYVNFLDRFDWKERIIICACIVSLALFVIGTLFKGVGGLFGGLFGAGDGEQQSSNFFNKEGYIQDYSEALNQGDYAKALEIYEKNKDDKKKLAKIMDCNEDFCGSFSGGTDAYKLLYSSNVFYYDDSAYDVLTNRVTETIDTVYNQYADEKINSEDAIYMLGLYLDFANDTISSKAQNCINDVYANEEEKAEIAAFNEMNEASGNNYALAEDYISAEEYSLAYDCLLLVDSQSDYYNDATSLMEDIRDLAVEEHLNNADLSIEAGEYANALGYIEEALLYDPENEMGLAKKEACIQAYVENLKTAASDASTNQDNQSSIDYIDEALIYMPDDETLLALKDTYEDLLEQQIEAEKAAEEAAKTLSTGLVYDTSKTTITVKNITLTDKILPESTSGYYWYQTVKDSTQIMFDIKIRVKNNNTSVIDICDLVESAKLLYDGTYTYKSYTVYYSTGSDLDEIYSWDAIGLNPLNEVTMHVVFILPVEVKNSGKSLTGSIKIDGVEKLINYQ